MRVTNLKPDREDVYPVDLGAGIRVPSVMSVSLTEIDVPGIASIDADLSVEGGQFVFETITFRAQLPGPGVTTEALKDVPVQQLGIALLNYAAQVSVDPPAWLVDGQAVYVDATVAPTERQRHALGRVESMAGPMTSRRRWITPEYLRRIAAIYVAAQAAGEPPTEAVRRAERLTYSTAAKHVGKAREMGYLGAAKEGRPKKAAATTTKRGKK